MEEMKDSVEEVIVDIDWYATGSLVIQSWT